MFGCPARVRLTVALVLKFSPERLDMVTDPVEIPEEGVIPVTEREFDLIENPFVRVPV